MKNRYELNQSNELIRNDSGTYTAESFVETYENLNELFVSGIPKYYINNDTITERTENEIFEILEATERETYRKAYCQREIRKLYSQDKEFQLQRQGIIDAYDLEFVDYYQNIEKIIEESKEISISQLINGVQ